MLACALVLSATSGHSAVLVEDLFTRGSAITPIDLNGSSPTTSNLGSLTYSASTSWDTNGTEAIVVANSVSAFLAFTPESGKVYSLSLSFNLSTTDANFLGFGFTNQNLYNSAILSSLDYAGSGPGLLFRGNGEALARINAGSTSLATGLADPATFTIILDTSNAAWTVSYLVNGVAAGSTYTYLTNPTISYIGFGNFSTARGSVDNFTLTAVPEPATFALALIGGLGLFIRQRRRLTAINS